MSSADLAPGALDTPVCLWPVAAELGEGPIWHAATGSVYFVDIKGRKIHRCEADGSDQRTWDAPGQASFIVPLESGGFVVGLRDGVHLFDEATGAFTPLHHVEADVEHNRFNDGFVDAQGALWFGSMHDPETDPSGALYRLDAKGVVTKVDPDYIITNGPAVSPDGATLYHTDTLGKQVYAFDLAADGSLSNKRPFVRIEGAGWPDGMAVDADGFVWIAVFRGHRIERYSSAGQLVQTIAFPVPNITKLAFGGDDLRTVYVTTAWKGLSSEERAQYPLAGALFTFRTDTPGMAQHEFSTKAFA
jgi:D-xylonolactonase